jgi:hypothetical protein
MKLEKKITFDVVIKEVNIEACLYYPHFRNVKYLGMNYYLPMPYLLFAKRTYHQDKVASLFLTVAEHRIDSLEDQIFPFPWYATFGPICLDQEHHTSLPTNVTLQQMITKFWGTPFYSSNYISGRAWERMSIVQIITMIPSIMRSKYCGKTIKDWLENWLR